MYKYDDGGRTEAGFKGLSGDCAVRSMAIATELSYNECRAIIKYYTSIGKTKSKAISKGVYKEDFNAALQSLGWEWVSAPKFTGRKARYYDIPGTAILRMARHFATVKDGVLLDSWDSRDKMVYGYWRKT